MPPAERLLGARLPPDPSPWSPGNGAHWGGLCVLVPTACHWATTNKTGPGRASLRVGSGWERVGTVSGVGPARRGRKADGSAGRRGPGDEPAAGVRCRVTVLPHQGGHVAGSTWRPRVLLGRSGRQD